jgi:hypothetical protein
VGDFNLDGRPDLAVANFGSANISALLGNGAGGFGAATNFGAGTNPQSVAVGDFNLDGRPDLAVANQISNNVSALLNSCTANTSPTINAVAVNRTEGAGVSNSQIATVGDAQDALNALSVKVNSLVSTTVNGVTVSNITVDAMGVVKANVEAACGATNASFTLRVTDSGGLYVEATLNVTVTAETTKPTILCNLIAAQTANANENCQAAAPDVRALVRAQSSDNCTTQAALTVTQSPAQGSMVSGSGAHPITVTVTDARGNFETCVVGFTVIDIIKPVIACNLIPAQTANADANCSAVVPDVRALVRAQSSDNCATQASLTVTQSPMQGSTVSGVGSHPITVTVKDAANNSETCVVGFTVNDVTKPVITCPSDIAVGTGGNSAVVNYAAPSVSDNCSGVGAPVCSTPSGSAFPLGVTTVTCSVKDAANNSNSCSFKVTVNKIAAGFSDPLACTGPGNVVTGAIQIANNGAAPANAAMTTTLPAGLLALPGTCAASVGSCSVVNASTVTYSNAIPAGQTVTITYQAQVGDQVATGAKLCALTEVSFNGGPKASVSPCVDVTCPAVGPGAIPDAKSPVSDQKTGSVLIYNLYTSSASNSNTQNTRINLTNTHGALPARVHLFFVDGSNCSVADSYVCLTANQTTSFLASDLDPGATGYIVAVAVDSQGCPMSFNYLIGDEYVKLSSGHAANLGAEAFSAIAGGLPLCNDSSSTAELKFDGVSYNQAPRVLALSNIPSMADGNDTLLVLNRVGGNLATGAATLSDLFGVFYDDTEKGVSFSFSPRSCQFRSSINNSFPRITPRFEQFVPSGRSGWLKLYSTSDQGILGAAINFNANAGSSAGTFNQGHNLSKLTLTSSASLTIPIFPPSC